MQFGFWNLNFTKLKKKKPNNYCHSAVFMVPQLWKDLLKNITHAFLCVCV